ncbi:MAG: biotin/lipoyl-binding protein [Saprospiraceae bacterium]
MYPAIGLVVILTGFLIWYFANQSGGEDKEVTFQKPEITDVVKKAVATGAVKPRKEVLIKPQVFGVIEELFVKAGSIVKKGQKIA